MSPRYPFGTHRGSFPSTIEVITAQRDAYGAVTLSGPAVSIPARVTRARLEDMDTQPAVETNRVKVYADGIKAYLPPVDSALALKVASAVRYKGLVYTVIRVVVPVDVSDTEAYVQVEAVVKAGAP